MLRTHTTHKVFLPLEHNPQLSRQQLLKIALDTTLADAQVFSEGMDGLSRVPALKIFSKFQGHLSMMAQGSGWFAETLSQRITELGGVPLTIEINRLRASMPKIVLTEDFDEAARTTTQALTHLLADLKQLHTAAEATNDEVLVPLCKQALQILAGNIWVVQCLRQSTLN